MRMHNKSGEWIYGAGRLYRSGQCNRGYFDSEWSDMQDCTDDVTDDVGDLIDDMDDLNCDFDDSNAQECVETFVAADCEDFYEGDAFDDCGVSEIWDC